MTKKINVLNDLETEEVSLVERGANKKVFAFTKGIAEESKTTISDTMIELIKTVADGEDRLDQLLKGCSDEEIQVAKANFRLQRGTIDVIKKGTMMSVLRSSGAVDVIEIEKDNIMQEKQEETVNIEKSELPDNVKALFKAQSQALKESNEAQELLRVALEDETNARIMKEYRDTCEKNYPLVTGADFDVMAKILKKAYEADEEVGKAIEDSWKVTNKSMADAAILSEMGQQGISGGIKTDIAKAIDDLIENDPDLTKSQALAKALSNNPDLYEA